MKQEIFREYDIRGIIDRDITVEVARAVGSALVTYCVRHDGHKGPIIIGHDHRLSSPTLANATIESVCATGRDVVCIGCVPTPAYYYALATITSAVGIMITASHNPAEYNGFKVNFGRDSLYGDHIQELYQIILEGNTPTGSGKVRQHEILEDYKASIISRCTVSRPFRVVADAGNGTAGLVVQEILEKIGCSVIPLYCDVDGTFPNHHPDPTVPENLAALIETVQSAHADLGIAFDGDSDRIGVVDEKGQILWGDRLLALYARDLLSRHRGAKVIFEVKCSLALHEMLVREGGIPVMYKTGHSLIKKKMKEEDALLAGEMSGHMFFGENYFGFDDALYAAALLAQIASQSMKPFSSLLEDVPNYPSTPELRIACPESMKKHVVDTICEQFRLTHEVIDVDGVRVVFPDGWGLVRMSNTQAILVLRFEARQSDRLRTIIEEFRAKLAAFPELDLSVLKYEG